MRTCDNCGENEDNCCELTGKEIGDDKDEPYINWKERK